WVKRPRPTMKTNDDEGPSAQGASARRLAGSGLLVGAVVLVVLIGLVHTRHAQNRAAIGTPFSATSTVASTDLLVEQASPVLRRSVSAPAFTAEEIVAGKVSQFGRSRREIARGIGRRLGREMPAEVEKFFDAIEGGKWEEIKAQWDVLSKRSGQ